MQTSNHNISTLIIAMSICDKCPDDGSCDNCLPVHTFGGLGRPNPLENLCKWDFEHLVNEGGSGEV